MKRGDRPGWRRAKLARYPHRRAASGVAIVKLLNFGPSVDPFCLFGPQIHLKHGGNCHRGIGLSPHCAQWGVVPPLPSSPLFFRNPNDSSRGDQSLASSERRHRPSVIITACCILLKCIIGQLMGLWVKFKAIFGVFFVLQSLK